MGKILDYAAEWIQSPHCTIKEKASLLLALNRVPGGLHKKYLELILQIFSSPQFHRTEVCVRLAPVFLQATRSSDAAIRVQFSRLIQDTMPPSISGRLQYVFGVQDWSGVGDAYWLTSALEWLLGAVEHVGPHGYVLHSVASLLAGSVAQPTNAVSHAVARHTAFTRSLAATVITPLTHTLHAHPSLTHDLWIALFPLFWGILSLPERTALERNITRLLSQDYHAQQPPTLQNTIATLLQGCFLLTQALSRVTHSCRPSSLATLPSLTTLTTLPSPYFRFRRHCPTRNTAIKSLKLPWIPWPISTWPCLTLTLTMACASLAPRIPKLPSLCRSLRLGPGLLPSKRTRLCS